jgi:hypothetical protein
VPARKSLNRRQFIQLAAAGGAVCLTGPKLWPFSGRIQSSPLISPGCRRSKVKVARLYMGIPKSHWPKPTLDLQQEIAFYRSEFSRMKGEFADIDFAVDELVTSSAQVSALRERLSGVDGILAIHLSIDIGDILKSILEAGQPTMIFARPYSGHEWVHFGELRRQPLGARMDCILTSDTGQLAVAVRPFRAIHHLREAKVMNLTTSDFSEYAGQVKGRFGTTTASRTVMPRPRPTAGSAGPSRSSNLRPGISLNPPSWPWPSRSSWMRRTPQ